MNPVTSNAVKAELTGNYYNKQSIDQKFTVTHQEISTLSGDYISCYKNGRIVTLNSPDDINNLPYGEHFVARLPSKYTPIETIYTHPSNVASYDLRVEIQSNGEVFYHNYYKTITAPHNFRWYITFISMD